MAAGELLQHVGRAIYRGTPLHFGRSAVHRYDDPGMNYGVSYLGFDLATALMESIFHDHQWHRRTRRVITLSELRGRVVRAVGVVEPLSLADLTAPGLVASKFGLNLSQLVSRRYPHSRRVSTMVHAMQDVVDGPVFDGIAYPSRNNPPATCVALFDRSAAKVDIVDDIDLCDHVDWPAFVSDYKVRVLPK